MRLDQVGCIYTLSTFQPRGTRYIKRKLNQWRTKDRPGANLDADTPTGNAS